MLNLDSAITLNEDAIDSPNLCEHFSRADLDRIGCWVYENYSRDKASREIWERRTSAAMDLAMQVQKEKSFPWAGCSNIAFPLVTIAALQFHARAYPAIVNGRSVVQARVVGEDPEGLATLRAERISKHMSYQLLEQDEAWEEGQDRGLLNVSIVGVGFKKTFYNPSLGHSISEFIPAKDLVVNYWAKSVESAQVKTHCFPLYKNDIYERCRRGSFVDILNESWYQGASRPRETENTQASDNRAGQTRPDNDDDAPFIFLEQHCYLDLDQDGYAEPLIITIEESSQQVVRIVTRFDRIEDIEYNRKKQIVRINAIEYFTKIPFIPAPDGGIYDIGFGVLLGPLNESVNSSLNQLFDAGTLSNTAGGFLGRGAKIKGGMYSFQPFGWHRVDATGDDLRKSIYPLPVREPSAVMFQLLSLIIDYTNRIAGATDMMVGENPGQNTPAETSRAMLEQGQKIYSAIFKRIWRSMKFEFKKLFILNSVHLPMEMSFGEGGKILREDYVLGQVGVVPAADPTIASEGARFAQARMLKEAAASTPGYDADEVERRFLRALGVDEVDKVYPGQASMEPPPPDVKVQLQEMKNQVTMAQLEQKKMEFALTMQETVRLNTAKIQQLMAQAARLEEQAGSEKGKQQITAFRAGIEAMREQNASMNKQLDMMMTEMKNGNSGRTGTGAGLEGSSGDAGLDALGLQPQGPVEGIVG